MRKLVQKYNRREIKLRSFALGWEKEQFIQMVGSHEAVKQEVLGNWEHTNQNDDEHLFNIEGMKEEDFLFPTSKNGLIAAKAAGRVAGEDGYWDVFDGIQDALFVQNKDISQQTVLEE